MIETESDDYNGTCCKSNCDATVSWERVDHNPCGVKIIVPQDMEPPIYMYYKLTNYYQNHRRYVRSRDDLQLRGDDPSQNTIDGLETACSYHFATNGSIINPCARFGPDSNPIRIALGRPDQELIRTRVGVGAGVGTWHAWHAWHAWRAVWGGTGHGNRPLACLTACQLLSQMWPDRLECLQRLVHTVLGYD